MNANDVLEILIQTPGFISGQSLAEALGVTRQAVWKEVCALRAQGFKIDSVTNRGYRLAAYPEYLNAPAIRAALSAKILGSNLEVLDSVGSTNDYLKSLGAKGCKSGTVAAARYQTGGKGRLGRSWQSGRDQSVMFSVLIRPSVPPSGAAAVTPLAGLAVCRALRRLTGLDCRIKWPNDVIVGRKKLAGILAEMSAEFDAVEFIVIGTGVNVDQAEFSAEIAAKATSLYLETGRHFDKNSLLAALLNQLEEEFLRSGLALSPSAIKEYSALCATLGRTVSFQSGNAPVSGTAEAVDAGGALIVRLPDGALCTVTSGEVTAQGIY